MIVGRRRVAFEAARAPRRARARTRRRGDALVGEEGVAVLVPRHGPSAGRASLDDPRLAARLPRAERSARRAVEAVLLLHLAGEGLHVLASRSSARARRAPPRASSKREPGRRPGRCRSDRRSLIHQLSAGMQRHEDTEARHQGHHRSAAVADERQRHADDRQQALTMPALTNTYTKNVSAMLPASRREKVSCGLQRDVEPAADDEQVAA